MVTLPFKVACYNREKQIWVINGQSLFFGWINSTVLWSHFVKWFFKSLINQTKFWFIIYQCIPKLNLRNVKSLLIHSTFKNIHFSQNRTLVVRLMTFHMNGTFASNANLVWHFCSVWLREIIVRRRNLNCKFSDLNDKKNWLLRSLIMEKSVWDKFKMRFDT